MQAGKLRHQVTIEAPTTTPNAFGERVETWAPFATVWASREDLAGREAFVAAQWRADVTTRFTLRFLDGVTAKMRVNDGGTLYNIASVSDPEGRGRTLVIIAARVL